MGGPGPGGRACCYPSAASRCETDPGSCARRCCRRPAAPAPAPAGPAPAAADAAACRRRFAFWLVLDHPAALFAARREALSHSSDQIPLCWSAFACLRRCCWCGVVAEERSGRGVHPGLGDRGWTLQYQAVYARNQEKIYLLHTPPILPKLARAVERAIYLLHSQRVMSSKSHCMILSS